MTRQTDCTAACKQLFQATKPTTKPVLPDFVCNGSFNDKCRALRVEFFPDTGDNLRAIPGAWFKPALFDLSESFHPVTSDDVQSALAGTPSTSAPGLDGTNYRVLLAVHSDDPLLLPTLFTALL